jgi:hypothetical protein
MSNLLGWPNLKSGGGPAAFNRFGPKPARASVAPGSQPPGSAFGPDTEIHRWRPVIDRQDDLQTFGSFPLGRYAEPFLVFAAHRVDSQKSPRWRPKWACNSEPPTRQSFGWFPADRFVRLSRWSEVIVVRQETSERRKPELRTAEIGSRSWKLRLRLEGAHQAVFFRFAILYAVLFSAFGAASPFLPGFSRAAMLPRRRAA